MGSRTVTRLGFSFEYLMWIFTRISGLTLILMAIVGFSLAMVMGARTQMDMGTLVRWSFFPNSYHIINSDIPDVVPGWANAFWQVMQLIIVFFGVTHGINGLRIIIEDYMGLTWARIFLRGLLFLLWLFLLIVAIFVVTTV
jgi:succinate dehydrogenase / fumarate reductase, membrane anchor subunit